MDYLLKNKVLNSPLYSVYCKYALAFLMLKSIKLYNKIKFYSDIPLKDGERQLDYKEVKKIWDYNSKTYPVEWKECERLYNSSSQRKRRLKDFISKLVLFCGTCLFVTLNFTDETLNSTSPKTRKQYVTRYLNNFNSVYVANIDFGDNHDYIDKKGKKRTATAREHYHAIINIDSIDYSLWHKYGGIKAEKVRKGDNDIGRLSTYITKLTNHAIKESTKRQTLIYGKTKTLKQRLTEIEKNV